LVTKSYQQFDNDEVNSINQIFQIINDKLLVIVINRNQLDKKNYNSDHKMS